MDQWAASPKLQNAQTADVIVITYSLCSSADTCRCLASFWMTNNGDFEAAGDVQDLESASSSKEARFAALGLYSSSPSGMPSRSFTWMASGIADQSEQLSAIRNLLSAGDYPRRGDVQVPKKRGTHGFIKRVLAAFLLRRM